MNSATGVVSRFLTLPEMRRVVLRDARVEDAADLLEIDRQVIEENVANVDDRLESQEERVARIGSQPAGAAWLVAEADGKVVGSLRLIPPEPRFLLHIRNLYIEIHRDWRGIGLGAAMIRHAARWAEAQGVELIALSVLDSNPRARALYSRLGFEITGHTPRLVKRPDGTYADDTQMILHLGGGSIVEHDSIDGVIE